MKPIFCVLFLILSCRSTTKTAADSSLEALDSSAMQKSLPLALGDGFSCLMDKKSQVQCIGGSTDQGWRPIRVAGAIPMLQALSAHSGAICGLGLKPQVIDRSIICWAGGESRKSTNSSEEAINFGTQSSMNLQSLALSKNELCLLQSEGRVVCGAFVKDQTKPVLNLQPVKGLSAIRGIRAGDNFACGWRQDTGVIYCWGDNSKGQLGLGGKLGRAKEAVAIAGFSGSLSTVELGARHACAINGSGEVFCWGDNSDWQLGTATDTAQSAQPLPVRGLPTQAQALALGDQHSCAQLIDGSVWCWGAMGRLGAESSSNSFIPLKVRLPVTSATLAAGSKHTCSQLTTGEIFCWGRNSQGELGNGSQDDVLLPEMMQGPR